MRVFSCDDKPACLYILSWYCFLHHGHRFQPCWNRELVGGGRGGGNENVQGGEGSGGADVSSSRGGDTGGVIDVDAVGVDAVGVVLMMVSKEDCLKLRREWKQAAATCNKTLQLSELAPSVSIMTRCCRLAIKAVLLLDLMGSEKILARFGVLGPGDKVRGAWAVGPTACAVAVVAWVVATPRADVSMALATS